MNADKASVFIGVHRRPFMFWLFSAVSPGCGQSLYTFSGFGAGCGSSCAFITTLKKSLLGERLPRPFSALRMRQVSLAMQRAFDLDSPPSDFATCLSLAH